MSILAEITVVIKGDESTYRQKFLCYEKVTNDLEDPVLADLIDQAKKHYNGTIEEIKIRMSFAWA